MEYVLTGQEMKQCDANTMEVFGVPSCVLMERAALASMEVFYQEHFDPERVLVLCGSGNNGGDGLAMARLLHQRGAALDVFFVGKESSCTEETARQLEICRNYGISLVSNPAFSEYNSIVDAIFGIGLSRKVQGEYLEVIEKANQASASILALDIPSGVHADTGMVMGGAVKADVTVTFAFCKRGLLLYQGKEHAGKVVPKEIGITKESFLGRVPKAYTYIKERTVLPDLLPARPSYANKGTFGKVLLIAGSSRMAGAALLAASGAYRSGAGLVQVFTDACNRQILHTGLPEAIVHTYMDGTGIRELEQAAGWPSVAAIGPGMGLEQEQRTLLCHALKHFTVPLILDADALNILSEFPEMLKGHKQPVIVTPHVGEMARLMHVEVREVQEDLCGAAARFAEEYQVICVLKDAGTVVSDGSSTYINQSGNNGMSTGGSGDVLTGIIAGLTAQGLELFQAACTAVWIHGLAGDAAAQEKGVYAMLAGDIIRALSSVIG